MASQTWQELSCWVFTALFFFIFFFFHAGCFYFGLIPRGLFLCIRLECMFPSLLSIGFSFAGFCHLACAPRALLYFLVSCDVREVVWRPLATSCFVTIGYDFYFSISVFFPRFASLLLEVQSNCVLWLLISTHHKKGLGSTTRDCHDRSETRFEHKDAWF